MSEITGYFKKRLAEEEMQVEIWQRRSDLDEVRARDLGDERDALKADKAMLVEALEAISESGLDLIEQLKSQNCMLPGEIDSFQEKLIKLKENHE